MKLKKILASLTATAMAVSVMAFTPSVSRGFEVSAETISGTELTYEQLLNYDSFEFSYSPFSVGDCSHEHSDNKYCPWCGVAVIAVVNPNEGEKNEQITWNDDGICYWWQPTNDLKAATNEDSSTCTATLSTADIISAFTSDTRWDSAYSIVKVMFQAQDCTLNSINGTPADTTEYATQIITVPEADAEVSNLFKFPGTFDTSKISGPNAGIEITFKTTGAYGGMQLIPLNNGTPDYDNVFATFQGNENTGTFTKFVKFSSFTPTASMALNVWDCTIDSIKIKNDSTKGSVYALPSSGEEVDSLSFTASNISLNVGDGPAETKLAFKSGITDFKPEFNIVGNAAKVKVGDNNTLIISPVSAGVTTITAKVTIPDTADSAGGSYTASCMVIVSEKSDSEILWSGSADQGTKWDWNPADISADNCNFKSGDKLVINFTVNGDADYHQLKIMDGSGDHNVLTSPAVSEWGTVDVTSSPYSIELNAADIANVNANGITITGYDVTITSVEKVSDSSSEDTSAEVIVESPAGITATVDQSELIDAVGLTPEEIAAGTKIVLNIESETSVSESNKKVIEDSVSEENDQIIELILEININKVSGNNNNVIHNLAKAIPITIDIPNYDPNKEYFIIHVKDDGTSERIDGTVSNGKFTFYAKSFSPYAIISQPRSNPPATVTSHRISIGSSHVYTNAASAAPGTAVRVFTDFGFDARVYAGNNLIASLRSGGTFTMPASDVRIVAVANMDGALLLNAKPVSYIFVYDTDMNSITTASSRKSKTDGEITVKLGAKYAGKTVTLYSGKKDTTNMITSETADKNGNVTFSVDLGENYTAVVE